MIDYLLYKSTINWWNCWNKLGPAIARDLRARCRRWCLNEGRTPSKRRSSLNPKFFDNEIAQTCSNFTRSSISRSISDNFERGRRGTRRSRRETVSAFSPFFDIVSTRIRLASIMSRNTYQQITSVQYLRILPLWMPRRSRDSSTFRTPLAITLRWSILSSRWRDYGTFQSFPLSLIVFSVLSVILGKWINIYFVIINNKGGNF